LSTTNKVYIVQTTSLYPFFIILFNNPVYKGVVELTTLFLLKPK